MKLPKQVQHAERGFAAMNAQDGVIPSGFFDTLKDIASVAAPILGQVAQTALPLIAGAI